VAKNAKVPYSDEERFDSQFKKRQSEIINEISIWSQSEPFQSKIREQIFSSLSSHDTLIDLSRRLYENGIFISNFKDLTKKEFEANANKTWIGRFKWLGIAVLASIITILAEFCIKKCF